MRQNTLSSAVERGVITATQAFLLTECLYASIVFDGCSQIRLNDYDSETDFALTMLSEDAKAENFTFEKFFISELDNIKSENKDIWRVYAMTTPYAFLGNVEINDEPPFANLLEQN